MRISRIILTDERGRIAITKGYEVLDTLALREMRACSLKFKMFRDVIM